MQKGIGQGIKFQLTQACVVPDFGRHSCINVTYYTVLSFQNLYCHTAILPPCLTAS